MPDLISIITTTEPSLRDCALDAACASRSLKELVNEAAALDAFRRQSENLYERVRALFFLYAIHRFHLPARLLQGSASPQDGTARATSLIPFAGYEHLLQRRFEEAIDRFLAVQQADGPSDAGSRAHWRWLIIGWRFKLLPARSDGASVPCEGTSGCSAWAILPISRCVSDPNS